MRKVAPILGSHGTLGVCLRERCYECDRCAFDIPGGAFRCCSHRRRSRYLDNSEAKEYSGKRSPTSISTFDAAMRAEYGYYPVYDLQDFPRLQAQDYMEAV